MKSTVDGSRTEEAGVAILLNDALDGGDVAVVGVAVSLLDGFDDAQGVGHRVRHGGGADADGGIAHQLHLALGLRGHVSQETLLSDRNLSQT